MQPKILRRKEQGRLDTQVAMEAHRIRRKAEQQFCEDKDSVKERLALLMGCNAPAPVADTAVDARVPAGYVLK